METITREEAEKICMEMATAIRKGALNEIEVLKGRLFDNAPTADELEPIWIMAGDNLEHIIEHMNDTLEDIEAGRFLPRQKEGVKT